MRRAGARVWWVPGLTAAVACSAVGASDRAIARTWQSSRDSRTVADSDGSHRHRHARLLHGDIFESNLGPAAAKPAFEPMNASFRYVGGPSDSVHVRKFLDCVKSRQKPLTDVETGFYSTLPLLLGVLAVRYGEQCNWDGKSAVACG